LETLQDKSFAIQIYFSLIKTYFCPMALFFYNIIIHIAGFALKLVALVNPKIKLFVQGRKNVFNNLKEFKPSKKILWMHCASLGEFEQGRPLLEHPEVQKNYSVVLTFFSPSGYEVQQKYAYADLILYLPLDTKSNAKKFIGLLKPHQTIFIKYEIWPNYLNELGKQNSNTLLVSGIFRENQFLFKPLGAFLRKAMQNITHFFVQDITSKTLLEKHNFNNISLAGDTRFDRVYEILKQDNHLDFITEFVADKTVFVAGSTWAEDEKLLTDYANKHQNKALKIIIAPHNINTKAIFNLKNSFKQKTLLFSEKEGKNTADYDILIIDTVGLLSKIYSYANFAYVGGGFGKAGIHNILEPATFGIPIVIAPVFDTFKEAVDLANKNALFIIHNQMEFDQAVQSLSNNKALAKEKGAMCKQYIEANIGATEKVIEYLD
jgi:3-deoxy-D-manno-octulosonic-acid transferase